MDILKEAEMIVENYILKIEEKEKQKVNINNKLKRKYKILKKYAIISSLFLVISLVLHCI